MDFSYSELPNKKLINLKTILFLIKYRYILILLLLNLKVNAQPASYISTDVGVFRFELSNCSTQLISNFGSLTDIAITPSGRLYGIDFYKLYHIDVFNGTVTQISTIDTLGGGFNSLVAIDDKWLLAIRVNSGLYKINTNTGDTVHVGNLGYYPAGDLTLFKGHYYMADVNNQLVKFTFNSSMNQLSSISSIGTMNTPFSSVYGVVTVGDTDCNTDSLELIAFENTNVFLVNPINGNCTSICNPLIMANITGATSLTEVQNQVFELKSFLPNIFTPNADGVNDFFKPIETIEGVSECLISVFNRWGNLVFESSLNGFAWDGTASNGENCNEGVYFYKISLKGYCDNESVLTGFVQLVR